MNSRGYQSVTMERNIIIILIFFTVVNYGLGFSSRDWFEISGCYSLGGTIIKNKTILPANEPGGCLQWCGTKAVALQNSTCLCINDGQNLSRTVEYFCSQSCSGVEEKFKCGGISNDHISVYRERREISADWGLLNGSECLTYSHVADQIVSQFVPDNCTEKHPFYCYSETAFDSQSCYRLTDINNKMTWYEALEACRPRDILWPAQDADICYDKYIHEAKFWVAVYQWTKDSTVVPTSTISTTTTAPSSAAPKTSTTLSTTTVTNFNTSTATMTPSTSTMSGNPSTTTAGTSTTSTTSLSSTSTTSTTIAPNIATTVSTSSTSITTSTSTSTNTTQSSRPPTSTIGTTSTTSKTTSFQIDPANIGLDGKESSASKTTGFQLDPLSIGLGAGIGLLVGFLISITIVYCRMRNKRTDTSRTENHLSDFQRGTKTFDKHVMNITAPLDHKWKENGFINTSRDLQNDEKNENTSL